MFWTYFAATPVAPRYFHSVPFLSWFALSQQTSLVSRFLPGVLDHPDGGGGCQWMVPSDVNVGYLTVCHGKWPIEIDGLPIKHRDFPWLC